MRPITSDDIARVEAMLNKFKKSMIGGDVEAELRFMQKLSFAERIRIGSAKLSYEFSDKADPRGRAEKLVTFCETALPALSRVFGEAALIKAVPKEAHDQELISVCEQLGGKGVVALLRRAMKP